MFQQLAILALAAGAVSAVSPERRQLSPYPNPWHYSNTSRISTTTTSSGGPTRTRCTTEWPTHYTTSSICTDGPTPSTSYWDYTSTVTGVYWSTVTCTEEYCQPKTTATTSQESNWPTPSPYWGETTSTFVVTWPVTDSYTTFTTTSTKTSTWWATITPKPQPPNGPWPSHPNGPSGPEGGNGQYPPNGSQGGDGDYSPNGPTGPEGANGGEGGNGWNGKNGWNGGNGWNGQQSPKGSWPSSPNSPVNGGSLPTVTVAAGFTSSIITKTSYVTVTMASATESGYWTTPVAGAKGAVGDWSGTTTSAAGWSTDSSSPSTTPTLASYNGVAGLKPAGALLGGALAAIVML